VEELGHRMSSSEFAEWKVYNEIEPFSFRRIEYQIAQLSSIVANMFKAKGKQAASPSDFMPDYLKLYKQRNEPKEKQSPNVIMRVLKGIESAFRKRGKVVKNV